MDASAVDLARLSAPLELSPWETASSRSIRISALSVAHAQDSAPYLLSSRSDPKLNTKIQVGDHLYFLCSRYPTDLTITQVICSYSLTENFFDSKKWAPRRTGSPIHADMRLHKFYSSSDSALSLSLSSLLMLANLVYCGSHTR